MSGIGIERIGGPVNVVGECPVWSAEEGAWYWVDIVARTIWRLDAVSGVRRSWRAPEMVGCIALKESGGLIAGMETGLFAVDLAADSGPPEQVSAMPLGAPEGLEAGMRFNDGRCDRQGRFWAGTMVMDMAAARAEGKLYRYDARAGLSAPIVSGLLVQNGLAWSPDGRTMYLSDSHPKSRLVWAFDYDVDSGEPRNRRVFVDMNLHPGRPDGAAMDVDGCYWTCANDAGCLLRFTPEGKLDRRIDVPMAKPSMCSFGGANMDELLVTSISAGQPPDDPWAGAVIRLRPGVQGTVESRFRG